MNSHVISRYFKISLCGLCSLFLLTALAGCGSRKSHAPRVLLIGMDGMDPILLKQFMDQGKLPNFQRLANTGGFRQLATSMPPQSPVAWSNVISGCDPGTHEIYDFIHRDPNPAEPDQAIAPYLSTSSIEAASVHRELSFGKWHIPLTSDRVILRREGPTFWDYLIKNGIDATLYRMPANYPAQDTHGDGHFQCLTGMGTPDLLGSYGEFTLFSAIAPSEGRTASGGKIKQLRAIKNRAEIELDGPPNFLLKPDEQGFVPPMKTKIELVRDPDEELVKITVGEKILLLKQGEWSDWIPIVFETGVPGSTVLASLRAPTSINGMVRIYVKSVRPIFELFVTPINIDPKQPAVPISVPSQFATELANATGQYFTAGIPEHSAEIQSAALDEDEWLRKANMILDERITQYRYALKEFKSGCMFFYFGSPDQISHIFWRDQDPDHPGRDPKQGDRYGKAIEDVYVKMDQMVGEALDAMKPEETLIVMSDHGFASYRRSVNLNTWLLEKGYIKLKDPDKGRSGQLFSNVDWAETTAYGIGLNGLYVNQKNREKFGIVNDGQDKKSLLKKITDELHLVQDTDGVKVVDTIYDTAKDYPEANPMIAPDLLIGYARNYRAGWSTLLGEFSTDIIEDNRDRWSGDHCIAAHLVPGILLSNKKITVDDPDLRDLAPTLLQLYGLPKPNEMSGRSLIDSK